MTTISAKVIADSTSYHGDRITTLELRYPRWLHSEFMTHRVMSRNAASSRAIPVQKMISAIRNDPAYPIHWGANQKGMQADEEVSGWRLHVAKFSWKIAMRLMTSIGSVMAFAGAHKQVINRLLEPFAHITVCVTSTEWENFLALRLHHAAEPHIRILAREIELSIERSTPRLLEKGQWHLPYVNSEDHSRAETENNSDWIEKLKKISVAGCASTSYTTVDNRFLSAPVAKNIYEKLAGSVPMHASPMEHQATPDWKNRKGQWCNPELHGNFKGFIQLRKTLIGENSGRPYK